MPSPTTRTALLMAPAHRLVIPVPEGGWLSLLQPKGASERLEIAARWRERAKMCAQIAGLPVIAGPVAVLAVIRLGSWQERGIRHHEDASLTIGSAKKGLVAAGVLPSTGRDVITYEEARIGATDPNGGQLILRLVEVGTDG